MIKQILRIEAVLDKTLDVESEEESILGNALSGADAWNVDDLVC